MAKLNGKTLHINRVKEIVENISKEEVQYVNLYYAMIIGHRKSVNIRTNWEYYSFDLTYNEFRKIAHILDELTGGNLQYR